MARFRIEFEEEKCIGCGSCEAVCPENWRLKGSKSHPKQLELDKIGCNREAEQNCPVQCIHIVEE